MKGELYQYDLDFIEECKEFFEADYRRVTYINEDGDRIALRYGADNGCVRLYELGDEKAFFHNIMEKCPVETVKKNREEITIDQHFIWITKNTVVEDAVSKSMDFQNRYGTIPNRVFLGLQEIERVLTFGENLEGSRILEMKIVPVEYQSHISVGLILE